MVGLSLFVKVIIYCCELVSIFFCSSLILLYSYSWSSLISVLFLFFCVLLSFVLLNVENNLSILKITLIEAEFEAESFSLFSQDTKKAIEQMFHLSFSIFFYFFFVLSRFLTSSYSFCCCE